MVASVWTMILVPAYDWRTLEEIAIAEQTPGITQYELARIARRLLYAGPDALATAQEARPIGGNFSRVSTWLEDKRGRSIKNGVEI